MARERRRQHGNESARAGRDKELVVRKAEDQSGGGKGRSEARLRSQAKGYSTKLSDFTLLANRGL